MKKVSYRYAKNNEKDLNILLQLSSKLEEYNKIFSTRPSEHFRGDWERYFLSEIKSSLNNENCFFIIAEIDNTPVGYLYYTICKQCDYFTIEEFFVLEEYRKMGIGKKLLALALTEAKKTDHIIRVEIFDWNKSAQVFYEKNGFEVDGIILEYKK